MNTIQPINPNIQPEEPATPIVPSVTQPATPATTSPLQETPVIPVQETPAAATQPTPTFNAASIYPTEFASQGGKILDESAQKSNKPDFSVGVSQVGIPVIVGGLSIYALVKILPPLFKATAITGASGFSDNDFNGIWLFVIFIVLQLVFGVVLSYKIFHGSKTALALLTGPLALYLQLSLLTRIVSPSAAFLVPVASSFAVWTFIVQIALAVLLIFAWTKDKKYYS